MTHAPNFTGLMAKSKHIHAIFVTLAHLQNSDTDELFLFQLREWVLFTHCDSNSYGHVFVIFGL